MGGQERKNRGRRESEREQREGRIEGGGRVEESQGKGE